MAYTSHGHQVPGTPVEGGRPPIHRCGGPPLCDICSKESAHHLIQYQNHISNTTKGSKVEFKKYTRKPFDVEAVEITDDNIEEVAEFIGTIRTKDEDNTKFIQVDRRLIPNVFRVYPGFFMTRMGDNIRCYSPRTFNEQFELTGDTDG